MPATSMLQTATLLLVGAAAGGVLMAVLRLRGQPHPPAWLAMGHGLLAASGLTLCIYAACSIGIPVLAQWALGLLGGAAIGGAILNLHYHWRQLTLPIPLMLAHGSAAATGVIMLLISAW